MSSDEQDQQNQRVKVAVKLLFKRIAEGKVVLDAERTPETVKAVEHVKFDEQGEPLLKTITGPLRALANMLAMQEIEVMQKEAEERERNSPAHDYLGTPVTVDEETLRVCAEKGTFSTLAFELYREAGIILGVCGHSYMAGEREGHSLSRNQAICAGLLIRITKLMIGVLELSAKANRGEVVMVLHRSIYESATNLRFLVLRDDPGIYDEFVRAGLGPERELYDLIQKNISDRGGEIQPIEERMLGSITRVTRMAGVRIEDIPKRQEWGGNLRERLKALDEEELYLSLQRIPSHAVHGTWVDLALHHLEEEDDGFVPEPKWSPVDARYLGPTALVVLRAAEEHMRHFFGELPELRPLYGRMRDLTERILKVDEAHEKWLVSRKRESPSRPSTRSYKTGATRPT